MRHHSFGQTTGIADNSAKVRSLLDTPKDESETLGRREATLIFQGEGSRRHENEVAARQASHFLDFFVKKVIAWQSERHVFSRQAFFFNREHRELIQASSFAKKERFMLTGASRLQ